MALRALLFVVVKYLAPSELGDVAFENVAFDNTIHANNTNDIMQHNNTSNTDHTNNVNTIVYNIISISLIQLLT